MVRSKNAGPFLISLDLVFPDRATYDAAKALGTVSRRSITKLYRLPLERVSEVFEYPAANSLKMNLMRVRPSGSVEERDVYGAQQHALLDLLPARRPEARPRRTRTHPHEPTEGFAAVAQARVLY